MPYPNSNTQDAKRNMIDNLENLRRAPNKTALPLETATDYSGYAKSQLLTEVKFLDQEVRKLRATNTILEDGLRQMENRVLASIVENGTAQQKLSQPPSPSTPLDEERILALRDENVMLAQALIDSENEITRMAKMLELLSAKLL